MTLNISEITKDTAIVIMLTRKDLPLPTKALTLVRTVPLSLRDSTVSQMMKMNVFFVVMPSLLRLTAFVVIYANMRTIKPALVCHLMYLLFLLPSSPRPDGSAGNVASSLTV